MMPVMLRLLQHRLMQVLIPLLTLAASPGLLLAQDDHPAHDARLENYAQSVVMDGGGTAMAWLLLVALAVLGLSVLFKDARRSHLD
jgi:hypothetical protein